MLALRTSFISLLYDEDDPVLDKPIIWGGEQVPLDSPADLRAGQTFSLVSFVYSETEDDIQANLVPVWQISKDEGFTWDDIDPDTSTRHTVNWTGFLYGGISGQIKSRYFDVALLITAGFRLDDVGQYRLKVTGGVLAEAFSSKVRIRLDSNPGG